MENLNQENFENPTSESNFKILEHLFEYAWWESDDELELLYGQLKSGVRIMSLDQFNILKTKFLGKELAQKFDMNGDLKEELERRYGENELCRIVRKKPVENRGTMPWTQEMIEQEIESLKIRTQKPLLKVLSGGNKK